MTFDIDAAGLTDRGRRRPQNQDNWKTLVPQGLFIVSDGMGGQAAGELASEIVVETLPALLAAGMPTDATIGTDERHLRRLLSELSDRVLQQTRDQPGLAGMGATVVVACLRGDRLLVGHMGDSRLYLWRGQQLQQLTQDHSIVQLLLDSGEIGPEDAKTHPARGRLTRFVGMPGAAIPETRQVALQPGDQLLLCTDGLTGMLGDDAIAAILAPGLPPEQSCGRLIAAANDAGGLDNITAVVVALASPPRPPTQDEQR